MAGKGAARGQLAGAESAIAYFEGEYRPLAEARVNVLTHAFLYGTATFEGIRAYWNAEERQLYGLKLRPHLERLRASCKILLMDPLPDVDALETIVVEVPHPGHPLGVRGVGECAIVPPLAAIANALHDALGVRMYDLPATPRVVLEHLLAGEGAQAAG